MVRFFDSSSNVLLKDIVSRPLGVAVDDPPYIRRTVGGFQSWFYPSLEGVSVGILISRGNNPRILPSAAIFSDPRKFFNNAISASVRDRGSSCTFASCASLGLTFSSSIIAFRMLSNFRSSSAWRRWRLCRTYSLKARSIISCAWMDGIAFLNARKVFGRHAPVGVGLFRTLGGYRARRIVSSFGSIVVRLLLAWRMGVMVALSKGRWGSKANREWKATGSSCRARWAPLKIFALSRQCGRGVTGPPPTTHITMHLQEKMPCQRRAGLNA